jgi:CheY-like chemotaxis protein
MAKRLLLADDSLTIQKVVGISFANEDVQITTVDNGDDALVRVRELRPDIVLADVVMPGKNGYEVCAAIKGDPELAHVPVLLLTGTFEAFDEERARRARADGHITKPFEAQTLVDEVNRLLARAARPAQAQAQPQPAPAAAPARPAAAESRPTLPVTPTPAPPAATRVHAGDDAFDFFDEDLAATPAAGPASAPAPAPAAPEPAPPAATAFELESGESGFDFAPVIEEPAPPRGASEAPTVVSGPSFTPHSDQTIALGAADVAADDEWPSGDDLDAAFEEDGLASLDLELERPRASQPAPAPSAAEKPTVLDFDGAAEASEAEFDFGFESRPHAAAPRDPLADFDTPDAAREALLDPDAGDVFAVSSSDLGAPRATAPVVPAPAPVREPVPTPEPEFGPEADFGPEPEFSPRPDLDEDEELLHEPAPAPAPAAARSDARPAQLAGGSPADALTPAVRERIHDSIEKIAWEAFADLPDTIVRQAVAKIEEIAWEVIPQMAEALIREEIRRLKGEE